MGHLLVTNDYPPKVGGIQSYLFELWRRLPSERVTVLTRDHPAAGEFDAAAGHRIVRVDHKVLLPTPRLVQHIRRLAGEVGASFVVLDPVFPLGRIGPSLKMDYGVVVHGAEVSVPGAIPGGRRVVADALRAAQLVIAAGNFPALESRRLLGAPLPTTVIVPPGIDVQRFSPLGPEARRNERRGIGVAPNARLIVSVSRLVPRKGMDVLIEASARLAPTHPELEVVIAGTGRDQKRLEKLIKRLQAPVRLLGRVDDASLARLYGCGDIFAMLARNRWLGVEQEGFGIVYVEAAACGVAAVAGRSGGTSDAVVDGVTGVVVDRPGDVAAVTKALGNLLDDELLRARLSHGARERAISMFDYDTLAHQLDAALIAAEQTAASR